MRKRLTATGAAALLVVAAGCATGDDETTSGQDDPAGTAQTTLPDTGTAAGDEPADGRANCVYADSADAAPGRDVTAPEADQSTEGTTSVRFTINGGDVPMTFDHAAAPCTVGAVVALVEQGFYDDTPCHRITVPQGEEGLAVLQCGDPTGTGMSGPGFSIQDEPPTDLDASTVMPGAASYPRGTIAMAKAAVPDSAGSQFFLVYADSALPPEYAVLGTIDEPGLAVLDEIADAGALSDDPSSPDSEVPAEDVQISEATIVD